MQQGHCNQDMLDRTTRKRGEKTQETGVKDGKSLGSDTRPQYNRQLGRERRSENDQMENPRLNSSRRNTMKRTIPLMPLVPCLLGSVTYGEPVEWTTGSGGNGHFYDVVFFTGSTFPDWSESRDLAASMTWQGMRGHLATLTSDAENDWLWDTFQPYLCYLGGYQPPGSPEPSGGWRWVIGEAWDYTNWGGGAPNDNIDEDVLQFHGPLWVNLWNDAREENIGNGVPGFVIEYETSPIPAASTWGAVALTLLLLSAGTLVLARRRFRTPATGERPGSLS